jgi:hypothetical protein
VTIVRVDSGFASALSEGHEFFRNYPDGLGVSLVYLVNLFSNPGSYQPVQLLLSPEAWAFVTTILALYATASLLRRAGGDTEQGLSVVFRDVVLKDRTGGEELASESHAKERLPR